LHDLAAIKAKIKIRKQTTFLLDAGDGLNV